MGFHPRGCNGKVGRGFQEHERLVGKFLVGGIFRVVDALELTPSQ